MRALVPTLALLVLLSGCSLLGSSGPGDPGIAGRTAIAPEERSTCEALGRADLGLMATDPVVLERSVAALEEAGARAPADVRPALEAAALAFKRSPAAVASDPHWSVVLAWFNARCGGVR